MYGRFVQRYFSKKGWSDENRRKQGLSSPEDLKKGAKNPEEESAPENIQASSEPVGESAKKVDELPADTQPEEVPAALSGPTDGTTLRLLPKILRTTKLYLASKNFYYSYDYDISRSLGRQIDIQSTPLHKSFDPLVSRTTQRSGLRNLNTNLVQFFWNQSLIQPFVQAGQVNFVVPVMQGYVSQREFVLTIGNEEGDASITDATSSAKETVARQDIELTNLKVIAEEQGERRFLLTLISRRSVARAGLRYLRRGVDDEGNVANSVESEQLLSSQSWDPSRKVYSFLQYRGSIPVFFSQSPYSFKPIPAFYGSEETNATAFKKHFEKLASRYGNVHSVSLVEKQGTESSVGEAFQRHASLLNSRGGVDGKGAQYLGFRWFDFHHVCRGMKFENVSILIDLIASTLDEFSWTVEQNGALVSTQTGVLRTNCMDCLDRTNVVQSAAAREMLEKQLAAEKCYIDLIRDPKTAWFNVMWADNGDAISRQYAGTAALKGDFTRTRKRHITGALTDFSLTLTRYYNNIVNDYFTQAVIDFLLGRATVQIFEEFEADMNAKDYAVDLRRVRQNAVETCEKIVIEDQNEDMITAWTLSAPAKSDSLRAEPFEECVLILTQQALYFCRFDWTTEKVREFERVELERVKAIVKGTYITSILGERHMDEQRNVGLKISYTTAEPGKGIIRTNTRSLANEIAADEVPTEQSPAAEASAATTTANKDEEPQPSVPESPNTEARFWAFKALPPNSAIAYGSEDNEAQQAPTEIEMIKTVCDEIKKAVDVANRDEGQVINVQDQDIISLAEARKSTTYLESIGYSLKKLVWS